MSDMLLCLHTYNYATIQLLLEEKKDNKKKDHYYHPLPEYLYNIILVLSFCS